MAYTQNQLLSSVSAYHLPFNAQAIDDVWARLAFQVRILVLGQLSGQIFWELFENLPSTGRGLHPSLLQSP